MEVSPRRGARAPLSAFVAFGVFWGGWAVLVPQVQEAVGASKGELGLALLGFATGSVPAMFAVRRVIDRWAHLLLPLSLLGLAGTALLPAVAGSVAALGLSLVVVGAWSGVVDVAINAEVAAIEAEAGRRLMELAHGLYAIGVIAGALAGGALREAGLDRLPIFGVLAAAVAVAALANGRRPPHPRGEAPPPLRIALPLALLGVACATAFVVESGLETWSALYLERDLDAGAAASASGPAAFAAAMATGRLTAQQLTRRLSDRALLSGGAGLAALGLVVAASAQVVPVAAAGCFLGGAGVSIAAPLLFGAAGRGAAANERASAVAATTTIGYLGFVVGPPLIGGVAEVTSLRASFGVLAGLALLLAAAAPRLALPGETRTAARGAV